MVFIVPSFKCSERASVNSGAFLREENMFNY